MNYHSHSHRNETWVVTSGTGYAIVDDISRDIRPGEVITMPAGLRHTVVAKTKLQLIEVQLGKDITVHDKEKFDFPDVRQ